MELKQFEIVGESYVLADEAKAVIQQLEAQKTELVSLINSIYSISYRVGAYHQDHLGNRCECRKCVDQRAFEALNKFTTA